MSFPRDPQEILEKSIAGLVKQGCLGSAGQFVDVDGLFCALGVLGTLTEFRTMEDLRFGEASTRRALFTAHDSCARRHKDKPPAEGLRAFLSMLQTELDRYDLNLRWPEELIPEELR